MKRYLPFVIVALVALASIGSGAMLYRARRPHVLSIPGSKTPNVRELFESYAGTIGLDVDKFKKDMDGEQVKAPVEADRQRGQSLGIQITPTLFINNQPLAPKDKNPEAIHAEINAALEKKSQT